MANPNLANVNSGYAKMAFQNVLSSFSNILVNSSTSNTVFKINSVFLSNFDSANTANVSLSISNAGIAYSIITNAVVPIQGSLIAISKDSSVYLEEGQFMQIRASTNNHIQAVISYDIIG